MGGALYSNTSPQKAFISVPVADLTVEPYFLFSKKEKSVEEYYHKIPFSGSWDACKRAHQLLFNEIVTVLEEHGPEVKIQISNFYFLKENESIPSDTYWMLKKNITYLEDLKQKKDDLSYIPHPISYKANNISDSYFEKIITLKKPFYDPVTKEIYSVGTRFVSVPDQEIKGTFDQGFFEVYIFDNLAKKIKTTQIPKVNCVRNYSSNPDDKIQNFVQVLRLWAYQKEGAIPYVLGGWSWTITCPTNDYEILQEKESSNYSIHRKKWPQISKTGFDCMGVIGRAAQVCDIPFYIKNTTTLLQNLEPLKKGEDIQEGDIIWYPGHVMVISSLKKNLIIEARGYERGYGKVQEISLENTIKEIKNFTELKNRYLEAKPITILYSDGRPWKTFKHFKILRIKSIWKNG